MAGPVRQRTRRLVGALVVVGIALSIVAGVAAQQHAKDTHRDWTAERADAVRIEIEQAVHRAVDGLAAIAVFLEVSDTHDQESLSAFVAGLDPSLSPIGIAYVTMVSGAELDAHLVEMRRTFPDYRITQLSPTGELIAAPLDRPVYYPVQLFHPGSLVEGLAVEEHAPPALLALGVDGGANPRWGSSLQAAIADDTAVVSPFIDVALGEAFAGQAFVAAVPVHDDRGAVSGLVAAPMIDLLLATSVDPSISDEVRWRITGGDGALSLTDHFTAITTAELPGTTWDIVVQATPEARSELVGLPAWGVTAIVLAITAVVALVVYVTVARTVSRRRFEELERLSIEKDRFLATVSHEIRTPLTVVMGIANELRDRGTDFELAEQEELVELMVEQSDEVAAIVDDLLVAARADYDEITVMPTQMDLLAEVRHLTETIATDAEVVGTETPAFADPNRFRQILRNLVTNAQRYGGPNVGVLVETVDGWASVAVTDDGPPIPEEHRPTIFDAYTSSGRLDPSLGSIGLGLGLYVSSRLAELLGGDLSYTHDGQRSVFRLRLPTAPPAVTAAPGTSTEASPLSGVVVHASTENPHPGRPAPPA